jgi:cytochrome b6
MSVPPGAATGAPRALPFFPHYALRDLRLALARRARGARRAVPVGARREGTRIRPAYKDIKPEWYFMFMFQTLKLVPGGEILGIEYEAIPILLFGLGGLLVLLVPF